MLLVMFKYDAKAVHESQSALQMDAECVSAHYLGKHLCDADAADVDSGTRAAQHLQYRQGQFVDSRRIVMVSVKSDVAR